MFQHIHKHTRERHGAHSYAFGGDKKQSTTTATSVADYSQVNTTTVDYNDLSNRTFTDSFNTNSNNTTANFTTIDSGVKINNTLDGGAISGIAGVAMSAGQNALDQVKQAFGLAGAVVAGANASQVNAYDYADGLFHGSLEAINDASTRAYNAWDRASMMQANATGAVQNAYADAKGTTQANQKLMLAVVAVAGVAVLAAARKG